MYNYVMLIGTLYSKDKDHFILKVNRNFKNEIGNYEADYIPIYCNNFLKDVINDNFEIGSFISVIGRIVMKDNNINIIAQRIMNNNNLEKGETY